MKNQLEKNLGKIAKEIVRAQRKALGQERADAIRRYEANHDAWRAAAGLPPLVRRADGRVVGVFRMG